MRGERKGKEGTSTVWLSFALHSRRILDDDSAPYLLPSLDPTLETQAGRKKEGEGDGEVVAREGCSVVWFLLCGNRRRERIYHAGGGPGRIGQREREGSREDDGSEGKRVDVHRD